MRKQTCKKIMSAAILPLTIFSFGLKVGAVGGIGGEDHLQSHLTRIEQICDNFDTSDNMQMMKNDLLNWYTNAYQNKPRRAQTAAKTLTSTLNSLYDVIKNQREERDRRTLSYIIGLIKVNDDTYFINAKKLNAFFGTQNINQSFKSAHYFCEKIQYFPNIQKYFKYVKHIDEDEENTWTIRQRLGTESNCKEVCNFFSMPVYDPYDPYNPWVSNTNTYPLNFAPKDNDTIFPYSPVGDSGLFSIGTQNDGNVNQDAFGDGIDAFGTDHNDTSFLNFN